MEMQVLLASLFTQVWNKTCWMLFEHLWCIHVLHNHSIRRGCQRAQTFHYGLFAANGPMGHKKSTCWMPSSALGHSKQSMTSWIHFLLDQCSSVFPILQQNVILYHVTVTCKGPIMTKKQSCKRNTRKWMALQTAHRINYLFHFHPAMFILLLVPSTGLVIRFEIKEVFLTLLGVIRALKAQASRGVQEHFTQENFWNQGPFTVQYLFGSIQLAVAWHSFVFNIQLTKFRD